jgi:hypothetical protein
MIVYALYFVIAITSKIVEAGFPVPDAKWCLPSANMTELSGCIAMTDLEDECGGKNSDEEKLECYCTQEMLDSFFEYVLATLHGPVPLELLRGSANLRGG